MIANKWTVTLMMSFMFYTYLSLWSSVNAATVQCEYNRRIVTFETDQVKDIKVNMVIRNDVANLYIRNINAMSLRTDYIVLTNEQKRNIIFTLECEKM